MVLSPCISPRVAPIPFVGTGAVGIQVGTLCVESWVDFLDVMFG